MCSHKCVESGGVIGNRRAGKHQRDGLDTTTPSFLPQSPRFIQTPCRWPTSRPLVPGDAEETKGSTRMLIQSLFFEALVLTQGRRSGLMLPGTFSPERIHLYTTFLYCWGSVSKPLYWKLESKLSLAFWGKLLYIVWQFLQYRIIVCGTCNWIWCSRNCSNRYTARGCNSIPKIWRTFYVNVYGVAAHSNKNT